MVNKDVLFQPMKIGSIEIKNRIIMAPMAGAFFIMGGKFNQKAATYYIERAKGGTGLIIPGISFLIDMGGHGDWFHNHYDEFVPNAKKMMDEIHKYGSKMFLQLGAGVGRALGVTSNMIKGHGYDPEKALICASESPNVFDPTITHRAMTKEEIHKIIEAYGLAAKMCKDAGIDGVEVHAVHEGYLLDQFSMECSNRRTDEYGGSARNRLRFACECIQEIKRVCGEDYPVSIRYSVTSKMKGWNSGAMPGENYVEFGRSMEESPEIARILEEAGADLLNADNGSYDSWYWAHPPVYMPKACNLPEVAFIKNFVNIPVVCAGRMEDIDICADAVETGKVDAVAIGRQLIADADWANKVQEEKYDDIRPCIACHHGCFGRLFDGKGLGCAVNAAAVREESYALKPAETVKNIVVVGGGLAGMEAARVAATRGHKVVLFEKTDVLGGVYIAAAAPSYKENDKRLIKWFIRQLKELNVDVRMNTEATPEVVKACEPDEIILATGTTPKKLPIKGFEKDNVVLATDYLLGKKEVGDSVVIIGGGLTGCEIGYELAMEGKKATVIEMKNEILDVPGLCSANSDMLRELLIYHGAEVVVNAKLAEITDNGIMIEQIPFVPTTPKLEKYRANFLNLPVGLHEFKADSVIIAAGYDSYLPNKEGFEAIAPVHVLGDSKKVGNILSAIWDGYECAMNL